MANQKKRRELDNLADAMVDNLFEISDEEVLEEFLEEGRGTSEINSIFNSIAETAKAEAGRARLKAHRDLMMAEKAVKVEANVPSISDVREFIARAAEKCPDYTQAARNESAGGLSDSDAFLVYFDLKELGCK